MGWVLFSNLCICFLFYRVLIQGMHHQIKIKILCSRSSATRGIASVHDYVKLRRYIWWIFRKWLHHFSLKWNWLSSPQISTCSMFHNLQCHWTTVENDWFCSIGDYADLENNIYRSEWIPDDMAIYLDYLPSFVFVMFLVEFFLYPMMSRLCYVKHDGASAWLIIILWYHRNWGN